MNKILFINMVKIWTIGTVASLIPFLYVSLIIGVPAVLISTLLVTLFFRKELSK